MEGLAMGGLVPHHPLTEFQAVSQPTNGIAGALLDGAREKIELRGTM